MERMRRKGKGTFEVVEVLCTQMCMGFCRRKWFWFIYTKRGNVSLFMILLWLSHSHCQLNGMNKSHRTTLAQCVVPPEWMSRTLFVPRLIEYNKTKCVSLIVSSSLLIQRSVWLPGCPWASSASDATQTSEENIEMKLNGTEFGLAGRVELCVCVCGVACVISIENRLPFILIWFWIEHNACLRVLRAAPLCFFLFHHPWNVAVIMALGYGRWV